MKELIKITENEQGQRLVSARELHEGLQVSERFSMWFKRMLQYGFIENEDFTGCKVFNTLAKQELQEYIITLDMAKEISMIQRNEIGKKFRQYFIECEKQLQSQQFKLPSNYKEALLQLVEAEEEKERLLLENSKLEYTNNILTHTNKTYTVTEIAKELNLKSAIALNEKLVKDKIQYKQNSTYVLYSDYANMGYTSIKQTVLDNGNVIYSTRWTDLGREFLLKKYSQFEFEI